MQTGSPKSPTGTGSRTARRAAWALLVGSACAAGANLAIAQPAPEAAEPGARPADVAPPAGEPVVRLASRNEQLKVVERFSKVVTVPDRIARVDGFDQEVIDVTALDSRSIRVHAKAPGVTTMTLIDEKDRPYTVDVLVVGDVRHLEEMIGRLFPQSAIEIVEVRESVVLRGWVTEPHQITEIVEIAEQFYPRVLNQMQVGCVQQVMLKVKVMEVQRGKLRKLGVDFLYTGDGGFVASVPGAIAPITGLGASYGGPATAELTGIGGATTLALGSITNNGIFSSFVEALKREDLLKILAEPNLVTMNGRPAKLLAGGKFPFAVAQGFGNVSVDFEEYGTRLETVPLVLNNHRVRLEIFAEVSSLDFANSAEVGGFSTPGLLTRNANTQVELNFGETLVIAGLIQTSKAGTTQKLPVLGDMPYIGAAFRRVTYDERETELVIMVTPELVAPMAPGEVPPGGPGLFTDDPTGKELFGYGMLEVPSYGDRCQGQCRPPEPTYDPHHPAGQEHIGGPGAAFMPGPGLPPGYVPSVVPPTPAPVETVIPIEPGPTVTPEFPPAAPTPGVSARFPQRRTPSAAKAARPTGVTPAGHTRSIGRVPAGRPGLIEPTRPTTGR